MGIRVPVKILCACGQKYAFEVEPADGEMPWVVTCPLCGADGTAAANAAIAHAGLSAARGSMHGSESPAATAPVALLPSGPIAKSPKDNSARDLLEQLKSEVSRVQANQLQTSSSKTLTASLPPARSSASVKTLVGIGLLFVPLLAYLALFLFMKNSAVPTKLFAVAVAVGLAGAWLVFSSIAATRSRKL